MTFVDGHEPTEYELIDLAACPEPRCRTGRSRKLDPDEHIIFSAIDVVNWRREQGFAGTQSLRGDIDGWT